MSEPTAELSTMDRAAYDILAQNQPGLIREIETAISQGATAKEVEARIIGRYGLYNLTAALAVCAAYHIEKNGVVQNEPTNLTAN